MKSINSAKEFCEHVKEIAEYWAKQPNCTPETIARGTAHSILTLISNCENVNADFTLWLNGYDVTPGLNMEFAELFKKAK